MSGSAANPEAAAFFKKILLFLGGLFGLTLVIAAVFFARNMADPVVNVPTPRLPNPNAFDVFVSAGKQIVRKDDIGDAVARTPKRFSSNAEKEALLRANLPALRGFRTGFSISFRQPPIRSTFARFPYYVDFRNAARLMSLQGSLRLQRGDVQGAADSWLDAVHLGRQISTGQPLIGTLVSISCQAIGRRPLWDNLNRLNASQSRASARRMEATAERRMPFAETIREEKYLVQSELNELFHDPEKWTRETGDETSKNKSDGGNQSSGLEVDYRTLFLLYGKTRILDNFTRYMDELAALAEEPYRANVPLPRLPSDPINADLLPTYDGARVKSLENETQTALMTVSLALRAYRLEHGQYPDALTQLVPAYLKSLPADPFGGSGALRYRRSGNTYLLYSVGPDAADNGGSPIDNPGETGQKRRYVDPKSKGDVVAGVNMY